VNLIQNHIQSLQLNKDMIESLFIYHRLLIHLRNTILMNIIIPNLILIILNIYIILILFIIDINQFAMILIIVINMEKHTILVGGICQSIQFMDLDHNALFIIIIIHRRNGTNYLPDNKNFYPIRKVIPFY
jgi:hypothetical protein